MNFVRSDCQQKQEAEANEAPIRNLDTSRLTVIRALQILLPCCQSPRPSLAVRSLAHSVHVCSESAGSQIFCPCLIGVPALTTALPAAGRKVICCQSVQMTFAFGCMTNDVYSLAMQTALHLLVAMALQVA